MTFVEKAMERLNKLIEQSAENSEEHTDYVVMKQACEKQIVKRTSYHSGCPVCGKAFSRKGYIGNYCDECGQKIEIDWGDEQ